MRLTGNTRFRATWRGKLVLQVQYSYSATIYGEVTTAFGWRDAKTQDIKSTSSSVEVHKHV